MLILRRRPGESLLIGDDVEIEVLEAGLWGVKVGIRAPKAVTILRKELQMTRNANCAAARDVRLADLARSLPSLARETATKDAAAGRKSPSPENEACDNPDGTSARGDLRIEHYGIQH